MTTPQSWNDLDLSVVRTPYFARLLREDPARNLAERYQALQRAQPELTEQLLGFVPGLIEHGWAVLTFFGEPMLYTVGLSYASDLPELMLVTAGQEVRDAHRMLNALARVQAESGRPLPAYDDLSGSFKEAGYPLVSLKFEPYSPSVERLFPCGKLYGFHQFFSDSDLNARESLPMLVARAYASTEVGLAMMRAQLDRQG